LTLPPPLTLKLTLKLPLALLTPLARKLSWLPPPPKVALWPRLARQAPTP
jgi:hypothetical protein